MDLKPIYGELKEKEKVKEMEEKPREEREYRKDCRKQCFTLSSIYHCTF